MVLLHWYDVTHGLKQRMAEVEGRAWEEEMAQETGEAGHEMKKTTARGSGRLFVKIRMVIKL